MKTKAMNRRTRAMKTKLKKYKEVMRWIAIIPLAALIPVPPINLILLVIQLTFFGLMFYVGWWYE